MCWAGCFAPLPIIFYDYNYEITHNPILQPGYKPPYPAGTEEIAMATVGYFLAPVIWIIYAVFSYGLFRLLGRGLGKWSGVALTLIPILIWKYNSDLSASPLRIVISSLVGMSPLALGIIHGLRDSRLYQATLKITN